jgi:hypothetical protein
MQDRWAIHIDIEGFGAQWNDTIDAFRGLNALMEGIFLIGNQVYSKPPERLFAHQFGDGFLIVSDFHEQNLDRAMLVCITLLRYVLSRGAVAKAAIAEGELSGIEGCYPEVIRKRNNDGRVFMGDGLMTVFPVMGTALIRSVGLDKKSPSGPLLTISSKNTARLSLDALKTHQIDNLIFVNWLKSEPSALSKLQIAAGIEQFSESERISQLRNYIASNTELKKEWVANAEKYLLN